MKDAAKIRSEIKAARTVARVNDIFRRAVRGIGFSTYAAGYVPSSARQSGDGSPQASPFLLLDWPKAWLELYAREGFAAEEIVAAEAARRSDPSPGLR